VSEGPEEAPVDAQREEAPVDAPREEASAKPQRRQLKTYPGLEASSFMHPWDVKATATLKKVPGLDTVTRKLMEYGFERFLHLECLADNLRITQRSFPRLHRYLRWSCKILDLPEPEMYVSLSGDYEPFTYGHTRPFIVLPSELLEVLTEEERFFIVAHEVGHIKAEHVLYTVLAENVRAIVDMIGKATLGIGSLLGGGLALPLYDWYRKAQLTADRAALLCVQDPEVAMRTFMKLAGAVHGLEDQLNLPEFLSQVRKYEDEHDSRLDKAYKLLITAIRTHPFPIMRAKQLDLWVRDGSFTELSGIEADLPQSSEQHTPGEPTVTDTATSEPL
jgi:Zn-dependent protease with chaperone function